MFAVSSQKMYYKIFASQKKKNGLLLKKKLKNVKEDKCLSQTKPYKTPAK